MEGRAVRLKIWAGAAATKKDRAARCPERAGTEPPAPAPRSTSQCVGLEYKNKSTSLRLQFPHLSGGLVIKLCLTLQSHGLQPTRLLCLWGFSRQEYWSGLPFPSPGELPDPGMEPTDPHLLQADSFTTEPPGSAGRATHRPLPQPCWLLGGQERCPELGSFTG